MRSLALALIAAVAGSAAGSAGAQVAPVPSFEDPRMQTVVYRPGSPVRLTAFPDAGLKLVLHQGEVIERVALSDGNAFRAAVIGSDTVELAPLRPGASATMRVATNREQYEFLLETGNGLAAAYLVRLVAGGGEQSEVHTAGPDPTAELWDYRMSGDRPLRPAKVEDDGVRTYISWYPQQALPAVFGIGPTGDEEIVAGYMRGQLYVIDRVYGELTFRADKDRAKAKRRKNRD